MDFNLCVSNKLKINLKIKYNIFMSIKSFMKYMHSMGTLQGSAIDDWVPERPKTKKAATLKGLKFHVILIV